MLIVRKKNIIVGLLVVLLIITGYLNFWFNQNSIQTNKFEDNEVSYKGSEKKQSDIQEHDIENEKSEFGGKITVTDLEEPSDLSNGEDLTETSSMQSSFFRDYRFERKQERNKEIEYINSVLNNPASDPEMIREAQSQLLEITSNMETELAIENLIKAKGFNDAIVIIHKDNVNVIIDKAELVPEEVAMILDIVKRETEKDIDNIKIIPKI